MNKIILNGPVNYVKLYNNNTNQYVHVFMDYHYDINYQQKCSQYEAIDIDKYFNHLLKSTEETIDFFLEIFPTDINKSCIYHYNDPYLYLIRTMFRNLYKELVNTPTIHNIRLHYIDIRDYSFYNIIIKNIKDIDLLFNNFNQNKNTILSNLNNIIKYINCINTTYNDPTKFNNIKQTELITSSNIEITDEILLDGFIQLLDKILNKYNNNNNKQNITNYFNNEYYETSLQIIEFINDLITEINTKEKLISDNHAADNNLLLFDVKLNSKKIIKRISYNLLFEINNEYVRSISDKIDILMTFILSTSCAIMDCFFMRRILEYEHIKKSIVYTGAMHSCVYIWFLIKYSDFEIIEANYIDTDKLDNNPFETLKQIILKSDDYRDLLNYLIPKKLTQCVEIYPI